MSDLINKTLEVMESNETSNIFTEAASKPSLGKLAADHYHHHSLHVYGNEAGRTNSQIKAHASNVEKIHSKIVAHHGKEAADAVAKHSDDAATVENASVGHVENHFHSKFVQKHLGGHGSKEHQEYKKQITHHGEDDIAAHQTEKDWNEHASNKINEEAQDETHSMLKDIAKKHRGMKHFYDAEKKVHVLHGHAKGDEITNYIEVKHAGEGTHHYYHSSDGNYEVHKKNLGKEDLHKQISKAWKRGDVDDSTSGEKE